MHTPSTTHPLRLLVALLGAVMLLAAACGDDDDGGGEALSDDEFCDLMEELEDEASDMDDLEALTLFTDVADQAPNPAVREAMQVFSDAIGDLEDLDEDDPDAMGEAFARMSEPEVVEAEETINTYLVDECGFDPEMGSGDEVAPSGDDGAEDDSGTNDEGTSGPQSDGSAMSDLGAGDVHDAMDEPFDQFAPDNIGGGVSIFPSGDLVIVEASVTDPSDVDGVAICEALAEVVDGMTDDPGVVLEVVVDDTTVAERQPGGTCASV